MLVRSIHKFSSASARRCILRVMDLYQSLNTVPLSLDASGPPLGGFLGLKDSSMLGIIIEIKVGRWVRPAV